MNSRVRPFKQHGIGLIGAIFVITLMVALAAGINLLVSENAQTNAEEINLTRAFFAAESGAGIVMNTVYPPEEYPAYATNAECVPGPRVYNFTSEGLAGCSVSVVCDPITVGTTTYATIESTGSCGDVSRIVQIRTSF